MSSVVLPDVAECCRISSLSHIRFLMQQHVHAKVRWGTCFQGKEVGENAYVCGGVGASLSWDDASCKSNGKMRKWVEVGGEGCLSDC